MKTRLFIFLTVVALAEIYSFIAVRSALKSMPNFWKYGLMGLYIFATVATWLGFILFRAHNWESIPLAVRNIFIAFTMGLWVGKILVGAIMAIDDIRRLVMWLAGLIFSVGSSKENIDAAGGIGGGITRSVFLKQVALVLGGTVFGWFHLWPKQPVQLPGAANAIKLCEPARCFQGVEDRPDIGYTFGQL